MCQHFDLFKRNKQAVCGLYLDCCGESSLAAVAGLDTIWHGDGCYAGVKGDSPQASILLMGSQWEEAGYLLYIDQHLGNTSQESGSDVPFGRKVVCANYPEATEARWSH